jgi:hypothetical protein
VSPSNSKGETILPTDSLTKPKNGRTEDGNERQVLVDRIAGFIERFVFLKNRSQYRLLALWFIQTHFYKEFDYTGYIFIHSLEPECGKTILMLLSRGLVANPTAIEVKPTSAVLFRMWRKPFPITISGCLDCSQYLPALLRASPAPVGAS